MSLEEATTRLNHLAELIAENIPSFTQEAATTAKAAIQDRIQEKGLSAELVSFQPYSKGYKKYKESRQGSGAVAYRNLTLTGEMWKDTGITSTGIQSGKYEVVVGGKTQEAQNKLNWNSDQVGDVLKVSKQEEENLREDYDNELKKLIKQAGL